MSYVNIVLLLIFQDGCLLFPLPDCSGYSFQKILKKKDKSRHLWLIPDVSVRAFNLLPLV